MRNNHPGLVPGWVFRSAHLALRKAGLLVVHCGHRNYNPKLIEVVDPETDQAQKAIQHPINPPGFITRLGMSSAFL